MNKTISEKLLIARYALEIYSLLMAKFRKFCNLDGLDSSYIWQVHTGHACKFAHFNITLQQCSSAGQLKTANFG